MPISLLWNKKLKPMRNIMSIKSEHVKQWRRNMKQKVVIAMGNKCQICAYNKCNDALELHHLDPNEKEADIQFQAIPLKELLKK